MNGRRPELKADINYLWGWIVTPRPPQGARIRILIRMRMKDEDEEEEVEEEQTNIYKSFLNLQKNIPINPRIELEFEFSI